MNVTYQSTRSAATKVTASQAILKGLADDGGLFVPDQIPQLDVSLDQIAKMSYQETAYEVMKLFLTDFTEDELKSCINRAYDDKFDTKEIAPLVEKAGAYYLELFHGATIAFKDMALSILPHLLTTSAKKNHITNEIVILTATSGDTGKAALAGFADVEGTSIIVFYPKNGVSKIQERQMVTQKGANTKVVGITGNFGNILAAFYAKNMGIPVGKLICASNENKVLYDFFDTGVYDRNREFVLTSSPSMDILISSNLERLIYRIAGEDAAKTKEMMDALSADGKYTLTEEMKAQLADFVGGWASEEKTAAEIKRVYDATGYVMDTHTAVASAVYLDYKDRTGDETKTVIASTASPYKFATSVMTAIDAKYEGMDDFALIDELSKVSGVSIPQAVEEIRSAPVLHDTVCETADMQKTVETILGL